MHDKWVHIKRKGKILRQETWTLHCTVFRLENKVTCNACKSKLCSEFYPTNYLKKKKKGISSGIRIKKKKKLYDRKNWQNQPTKPKLKQ